MKCNKKTSERTIVFYVFKEEVDFVNQLRDTLDDWLAPYENYKQLSKLSDSVEDAKGYVQKAEELRDKGFAHGQKGEKEAIKCYDEAVDLYQKAVQQCENNRNLFVEQIIIILVTKGIAFYQAGHKDEAIQVYDEVINTFWGGDNHSLDKWISKAFINKIRACGDSSSRDKEAIAACDEVVRRFRTAKDLSLKICVAIALRDKAAILVRCGRLNEAIQACDEVIHQFGQIEELKTYVGDALVNKYYALKRENRRDDMIATCDDIMNRFSNKDRDTREYVNFALQRKVDALYILNRYNEVRATYDEFIDKFWPCDNDYVKERVLTVLVYKVHDFLKLGDEESADKFFEEAIVRRFGTDPAMKEKIKEERATFEQQKELLPYLRDR